MDLIINLGWIALGFILGVICSYGYLSYTGSNIKLKK